jgi:hypothetical protein
VALSATARWMSWMLEKTSAIAEFTVVSGDL